MTNYSDIETALEMLCEACEAKFPGRNITFEWSIIVEPEFEDMDIVTDITIDDFLDGFGRDEEQ